MNTNTKPVYHRFFRLFAAMLFITVLVGCSHFHLPFERKLKVQQGNIITADRVSQVKTGMTKQQVSFIMGTALLDNTFQSNEWNYVYSYQEGDGPVDFRSVTISFDKQNKVKSVNTYHVSNHVPVPPKPKHKHHDDGDDHNSTDAKTHRNKAPVDTSASGSPQLRGTNPNPNMVVAPPS